MSKYLKVDQAVGERLRELRLQLGFRQAEIAKAARQVGLDWTQSTVAAIERGNRDLELGEFFLLPSIIGFAGGWTRSWPKLAEFFPASGRVSLSAATSADVDVLRGELAGQLDDDSRHPLGDYDTPVARRIREGTQRAVAEWKRLSPLWPGMTLRDAESAEEAARGDAERKAARKLGVHPRELSVAAHGRYGRSFTAERDARVAEQAPADTEPRSLQALRGHVTRAMLAELGPILEKGGRG
jgi:transcriptional regulator with XRE-family HTH domain